MDSMFQGTLVKSNRIIYTPSTFAKNNLLYLQEIGKLQAIQPHVSSHENLVSYLFFMVTEGSGTLHYDKAVYELSAGDCVFIDCRQPYAHRSSENLWSLKWIHFYGPHAHGIYEKYIERGGKPLFHPRNQSVFEELLDQLHAIAASEDYIRDMKINEKIASLLTMLMAESWHPENTTIAGQKKQSLQQVKDYLEEHYREKISLDDLSEIFYINKFYLTRIFKEQFGVSIFHCLAQIRITHAKHLLRFSDMTIEQIGQECGIDEPAYFGRLFKKIEGSTPGEYRKRWY